jgi:hypothetical protein
LFLASPLIQLAARRRIHDGLRLLAEVRALPVSRQRFGVR